MRDTKTLLHERSQLSARLDELEAATNESGWSDEQRTEYDTTIQSLETVNADLTRLTKRLEAERAGVKHDRAGGVQTSGAWEVPEASEEAPKAIETPIVYHGLTGQEGLDAIKTAFGAQLMDVYQAGTRHTMTPNLRQIEAAAQGAGEKIGSDGGFFVQTDVGGALMREIMTSGELLRRVRQVPLGPSSNGVTFMALDETSRATGSRFGGVQGYWVDEGTAPTATKPTWRKLELKLNKLAALGYATDELIEDGVALGSIMFDAFAEELRFLVEDAIFNGTGAGQPLGLLNSAAEVSVAKETGQAAATVVKQNIDKMYSRMFARSRPGAAWYINQDTEPQLEELSATVGTGGVPIYLPPGGIADTPNARLKGRPVIATEYNATVGTVGDIILADLSQYMFIAKLMQSASSMHVRFTTDEMAFRVTWRVDGRPSWIAALTPFKGSNTQSPYISLATRA